MKIQTMTMTGRRSRDAAPILGALVRTSAVLLVLAASAVAQQPIWHWDGEEDGDRFGFAVAGAGDVDGDQHPDLLVGAFNDAGGKSRGRVYLYSGRTGHLFASFDGEADYNGLVRCAGIGDLDRDGYDDFLLGAWSANFNDTASGRVYLYSGQALSLLATFDGEERLNNFGVAMAGLGDATGDGVLDFIVGAPTWTFYSPRASKGRAYVYSGADLKEIYRFTGETQYDYLGIAVSSVGDVDGDAHADILVGARLEGAEPGDDGNGRIYVYSGATGGLIYTLTGGREDALGASLAQTGDVDRDGFPDFLAGAPSGGRDAQGQVFVFSGPTGAVLFERTGTARYFAFGRAVAGPGDVNLDGVPDLVVGEPKHDARGENTGRVYLYSGRQGRLLYHFTGEEVFEYFGDALAAPGDVNRDGLPDLLVGAVYHPVGKDLLGGAWVFSGNDLFLQASAEAASGGDSLDLATRGGQPAALALLVLAEIDGAATFVPIVPGALDADGEWTFSGSVPPGLSGLELGLLSLAQRDPARGGLVDSSIERVAFQ